MEKIIITATAESIEQVKQLLEVGVDRIYVGEKDFGLRLPTTFSHDQLREIAKLVHDAGKELIVAVNALMHQDMMDRIKPFLDFLEEIKTDYITIGDAGVFYVVNRDGYSFKTIYDASTMVTSSRQINFWGQKAGASEAVLAREIPSAELFKMPEILEIPAEVLVYGASVIHHSKRPLLQNYYNFTHIDDEKTRKRDLFLAEPSDPESHYSIFEDNHGTHIFANNDLDLMTKLTELVEHGFTHWKLEGLYTPGQNFIEIAKLFIQARSLIQEGNFSHDQLREIAKVVHEAGKELIVAVNALMHQDMMNRIKPFLDFLEEIKTDYITIGDAGVFYVVNRDGYSFKTIYDASTMVTSSRQINFWGQKAGASEAVLAREIPSAELFKMPEILEIPAEVLVYGASVIHHSKRPLLQNYYNFTHIDDEKTRKRDLFLAEPSDPESHYSIFEDNHGTHIFANNDLDLMTKLTELVEHGFTHWKLEGLYTPGQNFVEIAKLFIQARSLIQEGNFSHDQAFLLDEEVRKLHPKNRFLDTGFYDYDPDMVK